MNRSARLLFAGCAFVAMGVIGTFAARALFGDDDPAEPTASSTGVELFTPDGLPITAESLSGFETPGSQPPTSPDLLVDPIRAVPVIAPVAVGFDDSVGEAVVNPPVPGTVPPGTDPADAMPIAGTPTAANVGSPDEGDTRTPELIAAASLASDIPTSLPSPSPTPTTTPTTSAPVTTDPTSTDPTTTEPVATDALGELPFFFAHELGINWTDLIDRFVFDPCAGFTAGTPAPAGCPTGYAATFGGTVDTPPPPMLFMSNGHYLSSTTGDGLTCPADTAPGAGQAPVTFFSYTPLDALHIRWRPYGTTEAWQTLDLPGATDSEQGWWYDRLAAEEWSIDWGALPVCAGLDHDPARAYEVEYDGIDSFGRVIAGNTLGVIPPDSPTQRPPTSAAFSGLGTAATVQTFTLAEGHVEVSRRAVTGDADRFECSGSDKVEADQIRRGGTVPAPVTIYDPAYRTGWNTRIEVPAGTKMLVCVEIFATDNPTRAAFVDRLVLSAPSQERPRIVLQAIRRLGTVEIASGMAITASSDVDRRGDWDGCSGTYVSAAIPPGAPLTIEEPIWECTLAAVPVDSSGSTNVVVQVRRDVDAGFAADVRTAEVAIPIELSDCRALEGCGRPREWYEVPIPTMDGRLCGTGFGSDGCSGEPPLDGIVVLRVEYPVIDGAVDSTASVLSLDAIVAGAPTGQPVIEIDGDTFVRTTDPFMLERTVHVFADRPVQLRATATEVDSGPCGSPSTWESPGFATEFDVRLTGFCAGAVYSFDYHVVDEAGNAYDLTGRRWYLADPVRTTIATRIDLLGGDDLPELGYFYVVSASIDHQDATNYWWDSYASRRGTAASCLGLSGTNFVSRGAPITIVFDPPTLDVVVRLHITTTGNGDCSGSGRTGLGEMEFSGSFTIDQLRAGGPLVLNSPDDARLRVAVTLTPGGAWR